MFTKKRFALLVAALTLGTLVLAACQPQVVEVEVTRVVTETVTEVVEGETVEVEVTRVVTEEVMVEEEEPESMASKDLIICMAQEPDTLYEWGGSMLVQTAVAHAIFESEWTTLSYGYQAEGIEKMPSLADGDATLESVEANAGDTVLGANGEPVTLEDGVEVINSDGETVVFDGTPVMMDQLTVNFTLRPRVWSDGEPVKASDSVYAFNTVADPDTPASKFTTDRTASYTATGDLTTQWIGIPGFRDSTYFTNVWGPLPEHLWSGFSAAELLEAEESSRLPVGDGPFAIVEWNAGESISLVKNENYYRADEGLPYLDSVTYRFIPDTNALVLSLLSGECDIGTQDGMDVSQSEFLLQAEEQGQLTPYFQTGTVYEHIDFGIDSYGDYGDDIGRPDWFEDARVRQAMTMCTDRQSMVDNIFFGKSEVIHTYIPSVHPLYPEGLTEWPFDVDQANALLDEVGFVDSDGDGIREYTDGTPFSVTLGTTTGNEMRQQLTQIFKDNMLACGIDIELYYQPSSEWFADGPDGVLFGRRFDLGEFAWLTGVEPSCSLYLSSQITGPVDEINPKTGTPFGGWGASSNTGWVNQDFDDACNAALASLPGTDAYVDNHAEAQRIFSEEVPVIPLFLRLKVAAARNNVLNFSVDPTQNSELYNLYEIDLDVEG
ncbi:MAG: peptide ABC transporter substrate-binding protein [Ardenticatenaceae bacterium]|nr:peptide ABC transporter substrate-binding protein [Ardenticatenaceae bacterium]